ncbi:MAG: DUF2269 domain-containing protein [Gemmatimonadaceae bacterium]|jgi:uncharacterized membrane protein|nr:DUF2269 domain-containing protein [Gemmatimonadaceae bacterium]
MIWKFLHVLAAVLMLGNVIVTGLWAELLWRWEGPTRFRSAARGIWWTDVAFTLGGGALLTVTGTVRAVQLGLPFWSTPWLRVGLLGLGLSTAIWLVVLLPAQRRMLVAEGAALRAALWQWRLWGWLAVVPLVWALWAMTTRAV